MIKTIVRVRNINLNGDYNLKIPEDIRNKLNLRKNETLLLIQKKSEIILKKEKDFLKETKNNKLWKKLSELSLENIE